jgi:predicted amidophosphoribosyltransferase
LIVAVRWTGVDVSRCPDCRAAVRPSDEWCSLCYRSLRAPEPEPEPEPEPVPVPVQVSAAVAGPPAVVTSEEPNSWPCTRCRAAVPFDADTCPMCGSSFLAGLRDTARHRGERSRSSRPVRLALATFVALLLAFALPLLVALL